MAKSGKILSILVVFLVILALNAHAQKQNQQSDKRQKVKQKEQQYLQEFQTGLKPIPAKNRNESRDKPNKRPAKAKKHRYITTEIPELGRVRGRTFRTEWSGKSIKQFLDIPYAKAPVGALRFKPPQPKEPWQGVLNAYKLHVGCPSSQDLHNFETWQKKKIDFEDCLRLSVSSKSYVKLEQIHDVAAAFKKFMLPSTERLDNEDEQFTAVLRSSSFCMCSD